MHKVNIFIGIIYDIILMWLLKRRQKGAVVGGAAFDREGTKN